MPPVTRRGCRGGETELMRPFRVSFSVSWHTGRPADSSGHVNLIRHGSPSADRLRRMTVICSALGLAGFQILFGLSQNVLTLRRVISRLLRGVHAPGRGRTSRAVVLRNAWGPKTVVRRRVTTDTPGRFIRSAGLGGAACLLLGGLDVGHQGVVREPGRLLMRLAGCLGCREEGLQRGAVAGGRGGVNSRLELRTVGGPWHLLGRVTGAGQQGRHQAGHDD